MKRLAFIVATIAILLIPRLGLCAGNTPTVSDVSGTIATGQTLTITGTYMVDEVTSRYSSPFTSSKASFEGTSLESDGLWTASGSCSYTTGTKLFGSKSLDCLNAGSSSWESQNNDYVWRDSFAQGSGNFCIRSYTAYVVGGDGSWPDENLKYWWVPGADGAAIFFQPEANGGSAPTQWHAYMDNTLNTVAGNPSGAFENGRWYCTEYCIYSDGTVNVWIDGQSIITGSTSLRSVGSNYTSLGVVTQWDTGSSYSMHQYIDSAAWGTQRLYPLSKIEISNNSDYATGTKVYQQPLSLADGTITIKANLTGLGDGPYYLWVTNNNPTRNADGYLLSGGGPDTTPPTMSTPLPSGSLSCPSGPTINETLSIATTNEDATCRYCQNGVGGCTSSTAYADMSGLTGGGTFDGTQRTHTKDITPSCGSSYTYYSRCIDAVGNANTSSSTHSFSVASESPPPPPNAPALTSPSDGATNQETSVTLDWAASVVDGSHGAADSYRVQVATDSEFSTVVYDQSGITATQQAVSGLSYSTTYYWRVNATNAGGVSSWSSTRSFTVKAAPTGENLLIESFDDNTLNWSFDGDTITVDTGVKYAGTSSAKFTWASGQQKPTGVTTYRYEFPTPQTSVYLSFYWRFNTDWVGSGLNYDPHIIYMLSNLDMDDLNSGDWGLAFSHLDTYTEVNYLTPRMGIQDGKNVNLYYGGVPNDLTSTTEDRDVSGCNGCLSTADCGTSSCYLDTGDYIGVRYWNGSSAVFTKDNTWKHVEVYYQMNTITDGVANADGIMWYKVDGVFYINKTKVMFRTGLSGVTGWSEFVLAPYIGGTDGAGSPANQTMWMDELVVATDAPGDSDTNDPVVVISTSSPQSTTSKLYTITGYSSDDTGVTSLTCSSDVGGTCSCSGTTTFTCIAGLKQGANVITVTAADAASNEGTDTITINATIHYVWPRH